MNLNQKVFYLPENAQVNFVIPSFQILSEKGVKHDELLPGIIHYTLDSDVYDPNQWQYANQRPDQWFKLRSLVNVTGSTMNAACGLDTLKKPQEHYDFAIYNNIAKPDFTTTQNYTIVLSRNIHV